MCYRTKLVDRQFVGCKYSIGRVYTIRKRNVDSVQKTVYICSNLVQINYDETIDRYNCIKIGKLFNFTKKRIFCKDVVIQVYVAMASLTKWGKGRA